MIGNASKEYIWWVMWLEVLSVINGTCSLWFSAEFMHCDFRNNITKMVKVCTVHIIWRLTFKGDL